VKLCPELRCPRFVPCPVHSPQGRPLKPFVVPVSVVCGPPGAGKTTYVREHAQPGDLIIDLDALYQAIGNADLHQHPAALMPFACEARDALVHRLSRRSDLRHAWVITTAPKKNERQRYTDAGADVIVLDTPAEVCQQRTRDRPSMAEWAQAIARWWTEYET